MWREIRNNFYDDEECAIYIDAWTTDDDNEEGKVIAKVFDDGSVEYINEKAKTDEYAQEVIKETIAELNK